MRGGTLMGKQGGSWASLMREEEEGGGSRKDGFRGEEEVRVE